MSQILIKLLDKFYFTYYPLNYRIIESRNKNFPVGKFVVGSFGWRDYTIDDGKISNELYAMNPYIIPDIGDLPVSLAIGSLGTPG